MELRQSYVMKWFHRRERFIPKSSRRVMSSSYCKKLNFIYIDRQNLYLRTTYRLHLNTRARCYCCEVVYALVREQKTTTLNMVGKQAQASALIGAQDGVGGLNARAAAAAAASDRRGSGNAAAAVMIRRCYNDSGERAQLVQSLTPLLLLLLRVHPLLR
uniref:Homeobox domain-containing protein n=1 Tax=Trichogramma kaykai TaxID=54128 RepID=A0ABD2XPW0_9HYME